MSWHAPPAELDTLCLSAIARFKRPKDYVFVEALPKNNYGKVLRPSCARMERQAGPETAEPCVAADRD